MANVWFLFWNKPETLARAEMKVWLPRPHLHLRLPQVKELQSLHLDGSLPHTSLITINASVPTSQDPPQHHSFPPSRNHLYPFGWYLVSPNFGGHNGRPRLQVIIHHGIPGGQVLSDFLNRLRLSSPRGPVEVAGGLGDESKEARRKECLRFSELQLTQFRFI